MNIESEIGEIMTSYKVKITETTLSIIPLFGKDKSLAAIYEVSE